MKEVKKEKPKAVFNWSGGKDSALALLKVLKEGEYDVIWLLTTINADSRRSTMHDIPLELLHRQANSIGIPLYVVDMNPNSDISNYEEAMRNAVSIFKREGVNHFIFGDIFLHDVKSYREKQLSPYGITVVEPLWGKSSEEIMQEFLESGLKTVIVTTTADVLDEKYVGRCIDKNMVNAFPKGIDVCGENGEYHTFCFDGEIFKQPVLFSLGTPVKKTFPIKMDDGSIKDFSYWFANLGI